MTLQSLCACIASSNTACCVQTRRCYRIALETKGVLQQLTRPSGRKAISSARRPVRLTWRKCTRAGSFCSVSHTMYWMLRLLGVFWAAVAPAVGSADTLRRTGLRSPARASACTASVWVAENRPAGVDVTS